MRITLNQQQTNIEETDTVLTVAKLVTDLDQDKPGVAVAVNQEIVARTDWVNKQVAAGDYVDIFSVIAGG